MNGLGDPFEWISEWVSDLTFPSVDRDEAIRKLETLVREKHPGHTNGFERRRFEAVIDALLFFVTEASLIGAVYGGVGSAKILRQICHAVFGHDLVISLLARENQMRRVLVLGETGSGKERVSRLIAQSIQILHRGTKASRETDAAVRIVSAANFGGEILRSELFGHKKGSFTGAVAENRGILGNMQDGDSLFIDEIGEASPVVQALLLRAVQDGHYRPVGATEERRRQFHLVAATNRSEDELRRGGAFRSDLFFRLASPSIRIPSLRTILDDSGKPHRVYKSVVDRVVLEDFKLGNPGELLGVGLLARELAGAVKKYQYRWPGNFRELRNVISQLIYTGIQHTDETIRYLAEGSQTTAEDSSASTNQARQVAPATLNEIKRVAYERACARHTSVTGVAKELDVSRQSAYRWINTYGLKLVSRN